MGIGATVRFIPLHHLPYVRSVAKMTPGGCPGADAVFEQLLSLPMYPPLTDDQVDAVCDAVRHAITAAETLRIPQEVRP